MIKNVALRFYIFAFILGAGLVCSSCGTVCNPAGGSGTGTAAVIGRTGGADAGQPHALLTPAQASSTCPVGGGGGSNCSSTQTPNEVLYTLDGLGNVIVYAIDSNGNLTLTCTKATAATSGVLAVSTPQAATNFLYVLDTSKAQIFGFIISHGKTVTLTPVNGSPFQFTDATIDPFSFIETDPLGRFVFVTDFTGGQIHVFKIQAGAGSLTEAAGSPFTDIGNPNYLAVSNNGNFAYAPDPVAGDIFILSISATGTLTPTSASPFLISSGPNDSPHFDAVSANGNFLYTADAGSVSGFTIDSSTGNLALIPGSTIDTSVFSVSPSLFAIDSTGAFMYAADSSTDTNNTGILGFSLDSTTGAISAGQVQGSPFDGTNIISWLASNPAGPQLFVLSEPGSKATGLDINRFGITLSSGALTAPTSPSTLSGAFNIAIANVQ